MADRRRHSRARHHDHDERHRHDGRAPYPRPIRALTAVALSWSGGKDSVLALRALSRENVTPAALITTVTDAYDRVSMHGVRLELVRRQAAAVGLPLVCVEIPAGCTNDLYEARLASALGGPTLRGVAEIAFGDLFLADVRAYRESHLAGIGLSARFPLWHLDTAELAREFVDDGFRAVVVCVDPRLVDASLVGREFDHEFLAGLPEGVDPCGENGEFHTFVYDGPNFETPVSCKRGKTVEREGFVFCDLVAADARPKVIAGAAGAIPQGRL